MPALKNDGMALLRTEGQTRTYGNPHYIGGPVPWVIRNILGPDEKRRTAYITGPADTWFSIPARMNIGGKWVKGFVSGPDVSDTLQEPRFHAQHNGHDNGQTPDDCRACWLAAMLSSQGQAAR